MSFITWVKGAFAAVSGLVAHLFGGFDLFLEALLVCLVVDFVTGIMAAAYEKRLNSEKCFQGLLKKVAILGIVAAACCVGYILGQPAIRGVVIGFYIANEVLSTLENAARMQVPVCKRFIGILEQLKDEMDNHDKNKEE